MDPFSLRTASAYINNLLLARGLLRNGAPVDFSQLATTTDDAGAKNAHRRNECNDSDNCTEIQGQVAAQVMNLVHDLILRRDRDQDHQETVADTLRNLRTEASNHSTTVTRLMNQNRELQQRATTQQAQIRNAQSSANAAETSARRLRDELAKAKVLIAQVRQQCDKDVKRRDLQIERLKTHLTTQQRGSNKSSSMIGQGITITSGAGRQAGDQHREEPQAPSLEDAEYSLQQETTDFLTELSSGLSDENDALIGLLKSTLTDLRTLLGQPTISFQDQGATGGQNTVLSHGIPNESAGAERNTLVHKLDSSYSSLSTELEAAVASLRELLTNPSFAPIEEVHVREDEIRRLRQGWEKMEARWREAADMMQGWRKRMASGGDTINLEELKRGLGLGVGLEGPNDHCRTVGSNLGSVEDKRLISEDNDVDQEEEENLLDDAGVFPIENRSPLLTHASRGSARILKQASVNIEPAAFLTFAPGIEQENISAFPADGTGDLVPVEKRKPVLPASSRLASRKGVTKTQPQHAVSHSQTDADALLEPELTVKEKLEFAANEARRVSSSSSPSHSSVQTHVQKPSFQKQTRSASAKRKAEDENTSSNARDGGVTSMKVKGITQSGEAAQEQKPVKRSRIPSAATSRTGRRKRKSTLSPQELEELMGMASRQDNIP